MRWARILTAAIAALCGTASAQSNFLGSPSEQVVPNFEAQTLVNALIPMGAKPEILTLESGYRVVGVEMPSGARFVMYPTACDDLQKDCRGVSMQTGFNFEGLTPENVNLFNATGGVLPKVALGEDGVARMFYYMIGDTGIMQANFFAHLAVMDGSIRRYLQFLNTNQGPRVDSVAVSLNGSAGANLLIDPQQEHPERDGKMTGAEAAYLNTAN